MYLLALLPSAFELAAIRIVFYSLSVAKICTDR
jgi:hypothetical protein